MKNLTTIATIALLGLSLAACSQKQVAEPMPTVSNDGAIKLVSQDGSSCPELEFNLNVIDSGAFAQLGAGNLPFDITGDLEPVNNDHVLMTWNYNDHDDQLFAAWLGTTPVTWNDDGTIASEGPIDWKLRTENMQTGIELGTDRNTRYSIFNLFTNPGTCLLSGPRDFDVVDLKKNGQWPVQ